MTPHATTKAPKPFVFRKEFFPLVRALRALVGTLWSTEGRQTFTWLTITIFLVICATVVAQVALNAWNRPFYNAIQERNLSAFAYQSLVFVVIAGTLLILNVAQAWLREMIKLKSREWLTRDLFAQWLEPGRAMRLVYAGEIGVNPDQRIQQDTSLLTELAAELGIGLLQASLRDPICGGRLVARLAGWWIARWLGCDTVSARIRTPLRACPGQSAGRQHCPAPS
jgi:putative ATP-binding cassette transporter